MPQHAVVSSADWIEARKRLLAEEKEFTRARDRVSAQRRELPWEAVEKDYAFEGADGKKKLAELFDGRSQLIVYHFMYAPDWEAGCKSCSFWADNFNGVVEHLKHRDATMVAISRAPYRNLAAYRKHMGWTFPWYSSGETTFNYDYHVSFTDREMADKSAFYNFKETDLDEDTDLPGISVFYNDGDGKIYHTYSAYARGLDLMNTAYNYLDLTPKGRDEGDLPWPMAWLRRHDEYESPA